MVIDKKARYDNLLPDIRRSSGGLSCRHLQLSTPLKCRFLATNLLSSCNAKIFHTCFLSGFRLSECIFTGKDALETFKRKKKVKKLGDLRASSFKCKQFAKSDSLSRQIIGSIIAFVYGKQASISRCIFLGGSITNVFIKSHLK